jgi:hypothetical protein
MKELDKLRFKVCVIFYFLYTHMSMPTSSSITGAISPVLICKRETNQSQQSFWDSLYGDMGLTKKFPPNHLGNKIKICKGISWRDGLLKVCNLRYNLMFASDLKALVPKGMWEPASSRPLDTTECGQIRSLFMQPQSAQIIANSSCWPWKQTTTSKKGYHVYQHGEH